MEQWGSLAKEHVEKAIKALGELLQRQGIRCRGILVGSAALMLRYDLRRSTKDIDVSIPPGVLPADVLSKYGIQIVPEGFLTLHEDYEDCLVYCGTYGGLELYTLDDYNLIISKVARGFSRDLEDVADSGILEKVDLTELAVKYVEAVKATVGDEATRLHHFLKLLDLVEERQLRTEEEVSRIRRFVRGELENAKQRLSSEKRRFFRP